MRSMNLDVTGFRPAREPRSLSDDCTLSVVSKMHCSISDKSEKNLAFIG